MQILYFPGQHKLFILVSYYLQMRLLRHIIIAIVTTECGWSVLCISKQDIVGQWVNAFSMAMHLALGRDEVWRLTQGSKGQLTPEHYSLPSPESSGHPGERPLQPAHQLGAPAVKKSNVGKEGEREVEREFSWQDVLESQDTLSFPSIHSTLCRLSIILTTLWFIQN